MRFVPETGNRKVSVDSISKEIKDFSKVGRRTQTPVVPRVARTTLTQFVVRVLYPERSPKAEREIYESKPQRALRRNEIEKEKI